MSPDGISQAQSKSLDDMVKRDEAGRCRLGVEILGFPLLCSNQILIIWPLFFKQETGSIFSGESIQQGTSGDSDIGDSPQIKFHIILSTLSQKLPEVLSASNEIFSYPLPLKKMTQTERLSDT